MFFEQFPHSHDPSVLNRSNLFPGGFLFALSPRLPWVVLLCIDVLVIFVLAVLCFGTEATALEIREAFDKWRGVRQLYTDRGEKGARQLYSEPNPGWGLPRPQQTLPRLIHERRRPLDEVLWADGETPIRRPLDEVLWADGETPIELSGAVVAPIKIANRFMHGTAFIRIQTLGPVTIATSDINTIY